MIRTGFLILFFLCLLTLQISFIHALPFPFDRIPLILLITVYFYQYLNQKYVWWWLVFYGVSLDFFSISYAGFETISYSILAILTVVLAKQVFTNRSFYAVSATMVICLFVLTISQLMSVFISTLFKNQPSVEWQTIVETNGWGALLGCFVLFFLFPFVQQILKKFQRVFLKIR